MAEPHRGPEPSASRPRPLTCLRGGSAAPAASAARERAARESAPREPAPQKQAPREPAPREPAPQEPAPRKPAPTSTRRAGGSSRGRGAGPASGAGAVGAAVGIPRRAVHGAAPSAGGAELRAPSALRESKATTKVLFVLPAIEHVALCLFDLQGVQSSSLHELKSACFWSGSQ